MTSIPMQSFPGYSAQAIQFLIDLNKNNNRDWFQEFKPVYEKELKEPSERLIHVMAERFAALDLPYKADTRSSMFRIYRDIRFSKNKDPYKTNIGLLFPYAPGNLTGKPVEHPGLYLHIGYDETFVAGGIHMPSPQALRSIRQYLADNFEEFADIINDKDFVTEFRTFSNENSLVKAPKGFPADHPATDYLRLKEYTIYNKLDFSDVTSGQLPELLERKAVVMEPALDFLYRAMQAG